MGSLTEREILDQLKSSLKECADYAYQLSIGKRGPIYPKFVEAMKLAEGACRQAGHWREDARWFPFGLQIHEAQQRCGRWLREKAPAAKFAKLAEILRAALKQANDLETKRTGKVGAVLPIIKPAPFRDTKPVSVILPPGYERETVH